MIFCFNPYFIGLASFMSNGGMFTVENDRFQSLFYWISFFYFDACCIFPAGVFVSILILLDQLLLLSNKKKPRRAEVGFNPYFIGLASFIQIMQQENFLTICFNPYFIGLASFIRNRYHRKTIQLVVSILILLDQLLL